jgi:hypothetical protein
VNIFKSLSQGNGRISETNITSFLSYLLNSANELNNSFLILFFELIDNNLSSAKILPLLNLKQSTLRDRIIEFHKKYSVIAEPEYSIDNRKQIVDIFLRIISKEEEDIAYFLIENKIKKEANNSEQALKQFLQFSNSEDYNGTLPIYSILLTTDSERFSVMHKSALGSNENSAWLKWTNHKNTENSIEAILRKLIKYEHEPEIQPIDPNSQFIIKSFIDYILTEYSFKESGQKNFSFNGFDVVSTANAELEGKKYIIKRFENNMIRLFDESENLRDIDVKPILRAVNDKYKLQIPSVFPGGKLKNTQVLGKDVINALNEGEYK